MTGSTAISLALAELVGLTLGALGCGGASVRLMVEV